MFPLLGLVAAGIFAAAEAGKAIAASAAPKPLSPESIQKTYRDRRSEATRSAYSQGMHSLQSLARSGGDAGSQASALRAAALAAPEVAGQATMAGYSAGASAAASETGAMQDARSRETNQAFQVADQWGRAANSIGLGVNDAKAGAIAARATHPQAGPVPSTLMPQSANNFAPPAPLSYDPYAMGRGGVGDGYGTGSDARSKTRIRDLEGENARLQSLLQREGAPAGMNDMRAPAPAPASAVSPDQSGAVPDVDRLQLSNELAGMLDEYRRLGLPPPDIDELAAEFPDDPNDVDAVVAPPANDPRYDTYVPPPKPKKPAPDAKATKKKQLKELTLKGLTSNIGVMGNK